MVETLYNLAKKAHATDAALHGTNKETCEECRALAYTKKKLDEAAEYGEAVVLYIP